MRDKVLRWIAAQELLVPGDTVLVALSGGADSVTLLHILISIEELYKLKIRAFHYHHGIRGEEADRDARFCAALCERLMVPLTVEREDIPACAARSGESVELCARRLRYAALADCADALGGAKIATAHHRNDNTETVLLNLVRGTGLAGLAGIPAKRENIIRPLLTCSREEIEAYCRENNLDYITDSTNLSSVYARNKLRLDVLPVLRELNPALDENVMRTAHLLRDADTYLDKISLEELNKCKTDYGYRCEALLQLDRTVLSYAVKHLLEDARVPVDYRHIGLVTDALADRGAVDLGNGCRAVCAQGILRITDGKEPADGFACIPAEEYCRHHARRMSLSRLRAATTDALPEQNAAGSKDAIVHKLFFQNAIPCDIISDSVVARHRRAGDTFTDPRRGVTKTLKKLFNELRIPRELRDSLPLLAEGSTVLWIRGIGTAKQAQPSDAYAGDVYIMDNADHESLTTETMGDYHA